jgi:hypothetical protein
MFRPQADPLHHGAPGFLPLFRRQGRAVDLQRFFQHGPDALARIQGTIGILEDHLNGLTQLARHIAAFLAMDGIQAINL